MVIHTPKCQRNNEANRKCEYPVPAPTQQTTARGIYLLLYLRAKKLLYLYDMIWSGRQLAIYIDRDIKERENNPGSEREGFE